MENSPSQHRQQAHAWSKPFLPLQTKFKQNLYSAPQLRDGPRLTQCVPVLTVWSLVCSISESSRAAGREETGEWFQLEMGRVSYEHKGDCCNIRLKRLSRGNRNQDRTRMEKAWVAASPRSNLVHHRLPGQKRRWGKNVRHLGIALSPESLSG